jgi:hypothetical protein
MANKTDLGIEEMLAALRSQAMYGRTHLYIAKGLMREKADTEKLTPTFFGLTLDAHLQTAQMYAAKLYDKPSESVTVRSLLKKADMSAGRFPCATPQEVRNKVAIARLMMSTLEPIVEAIQIRRNEYLAHLAPQTVIDLGDLYVRSALTVDGLDEVLVETTNILNLFSQMLDGTLSASMLQGSEDYNVVLKLAAEKSSE